MIAGKGEAVGRHPVIGEGERGGEIARAPLRRAVDAGLERIALAAAQSLREIPIGAGAGQREADDRAGRLDEREAVADLERPQGVSVVEPAAG